MLCCSDLFLFRCFGVPECGGVRGIPKALAFAGAMPFKELVWLRSINSLLYLYFVLETVL